MKDFEVELALVTSLDGFTTNGDKPPFMWTSDEDRLHLEQLKAEYLIEKGGVLIFGGNTYRGLRGHLDTDSGHLRKVITHDPGGYLSEAIPGKLEFTNQSPAELIQSLKESEGPVFTRALLLGGEGLITEFLKAGLIDKVSWTYVKQTFGYGKKVVLPPYNLRLQPETHYQDLGPDSFLITGRVHY